MEICCIIPARGGSKGIKNKNILHLGGIPLICHTINTAKQTKLIKRVIVTTDDNKISKIAVESGAEVVKRPIGISGDLSSSEESLVHALEYLKGKENYAFSLLVRK